MTFFGNFLIFSIIYIYFYFEAHNSDCQLNYWKEMNNKK